jgi:hypothetical protein
VTATTARVCRRCASPIVLAGGAWVVQGTGATADGLSYCPPDPDAARNRNHAPAAPQRPGHN